MTASIPRLCLIHLKPCNCNKIKIFFTHNSEKDYSNLSSNFLIKIGKTTLCFYVMFPFFFKFLQTPLIMKELIKHKNKFNRKVFHDRENSENRFSEFSYFMKALKGRIHWEIFLSEHFMKYSFKGIL